MSANLETCFRIVLLGLVGLAAGAVPAVGLGLELVERDRHFRAKAAVSRTVRVANDGPTTATWRLAWTTAVGEAVLESGTLAAQAPPTGSVTVPLLLRMPAARRTVDVQLVMTATGGTAGTARLDNTFRVYPERMELPWAFLRERRIGVLDRSGTLTARLRALGGRPLVMRSLEDAEDFSGDLLVIGEEGLNGPQAWVTLREALRRDHLRCPVLALHQAWGEPAEGTWCEVWSCAPRHPLFRELTARDLEGWHGGGVTRGPWLDEPVGKGCCLLHVASGWSNYGRLVLTEETPAPGRILLRCQVSLLGRWDEEPACELLLNVLMRHAIASGEPARTEREPKNKREG